MNELAINHFITVKINNAGSPDFGMLIDYDRRQDPM